MTTKLFQVKNVDSEKITNFSKYCKDRGIEQRIPLERWLNKFKNA